MFSPNPAATAKNVLPHH